MKKLIITIIALMLTVSAFAGGKQARSRIKGIGLEQAITESAGFLIDRLPERRIIAILGIEAPTRACSDFIHQELWNRFQESGKFNMADQQNTERIQRQLEFQAGGSVSEETAQGIGKLYGPQTIVYGRLVKMGAIYRLNLFSTAVEAGTSEQTSKNVRPRDQVLAKLLEPGDLDSRIENAITEMASRLDQRILIGVGRISYENTGTVTDLSGFLEKQIRFSAGRLYTRYAVADEKASNEYAIKSLNPSWIDDSPYAIRAMVKGSYYPYNRNDAQVMLNLISTASGKEQLGTCKFVISAKEMTRLNLSMIPGNYSSRNDHAEVQRILSNFDTSHNAFEFSAHPSRPNAMYYDGDLITFSLYASEDCYFLVQVLQVDGMLKDMYPTETWENNVIKAGETRTLPDAGPIELGQPFGEEYFLFTAYNEQFAILKEEGGKATGGGLRGATKKAPAPGNLTRPSDRDLQPLARAIFSYTVSP